MATGTMNDSGGSSKYSPGSPSSLAKLGVDQRIAEGTQGSRPNLAHKEYGGVSETGDFYHGNSAATTSAERNSGSDQKPSSGAGFLGAGASAIPGSVGARENMTLGGGKAPKGALRGGAKGKPINPESLLKGGPVQSNDGFKQGTARADRNMAKARKGIGGMKTGSGTGNGPKT